MTKRPAAETEPSSTETTIEFIAIDADDTLWHNVPLFTATQEKFMELLAPHHDREDIDRALYETEKRNLEIYGYGIKEFTLSMIETAVDLTDGRIGGREIQAIIDYGKELQSQPVEILEHVEETLDHLAEQYALMIITKGDLFDQESKIARSRLDHYFRHIEVVSEKTSDSYATVLAKYGIPKERFLMVGDSLRSDVLPVISLGAQAVHIPYEVTWAHEQIDEPVKSSYHELESIRDLPPLIDRLGRPGGDPEREHGW